MGTLTTISTNKQYKKCTYAYNGETTTGVHIFTTKSGQSVAPAISTEKKLLSDMNPLNVNGTKVIAKTNGCMFSYELSEFYGFFYQGAGNPMYINGVQYNSLPTSSILYNDPKYYPSFCIKSDGTATIRWFSSKSEAQLALQYCDYVIGACHPLVYDSKCVFNEDVREPDVLGGKLIYNRNKPAASERYNTGINQSKNRRTLLGHKTDGTFVMVVTDGTMSMKNAANLMYDLKCDYAVNMDGGSPVEMRIASSTYGPAGKVSSGGGFNINTAVVAYTV